MNLCRVLALIVVISVTTGCRRDVPIYNVNGHSVPPAARALSMAEIRDVIMLAGADRGWTFEEVGPGFMIAILIVRSHTVRADIKYSQIEYSIKYKDSVNMRYTGSTIHKKYNTWIVKLERDIESDLLRKGIQAN